VNDVVSQDSSSGPLVRVFEVACRGHSSTGTEVSRADEIAYTRRGVYVKQLWKRSIVADTGSALFYRSGVEYSVDHPVPGGDRCLVVRLRDELMEDLPGTRGHHPFRLERVDLDPCSLLLLHRLAAALPWRDGLEIEELALALALRSLRASGHEKGSGRRGETDRVRRAQVEQVRLLLAERSMAKLTLAEIAGETAFTPWHLARVFREVTGTSIHRFVLRLRLARALDRLEPEANLARVALECGFSSHSHFTHAFRREFGIPPSMIARRASQSHESNPARF